MIDSKILPSQDGFDLRAHTEYDSDSSPLDSDCYTPKQVSAFNQGDWTYVGIIVTASRAGIDLGSASIWSIEAGMYVMTDENDNVVSEKWIDPLDASDEDSALAYYGPSLIAEAIAEAQKNIAAINASETV